MTASQLKDVARQHVGLTVIRGCVTGDTGNGARDCLIEVHPSPDTMLTRFVTVEWLKRMREELDRIYAHGAPVTAVDVSSDTFHGECFISLKDVRRWRAAIDRVLYGGLESADTYEDEGDDEEADL